MSTPTTPQPTELVRHPQEVIEAAKIVCDIPTRAHLFRLSQEQIMAVNCLSDYDVWELRLIDAISEAAEVLRDALACAEADLAEAMRRIADDNKAYGCELMDPCGTIWEQCAKVQQELAAERQRREKAEADERESRRLAAEAQDKVDSLGLMVEQLQHALSAEREHADRQAERIRYLEGATNHAAGTPLTAERRRREKAEADIEKARGELVELRERNKRLMDAAKRLAKTRNNIIREHAKPPSSL